MSSKSIIVATPYSADLNRWQDILSDTPELRIQAHAPSLMELFNKVEHGPPNVVLIESGLCATDEFELIVTLFDALDVRW
jgi:DNA-binding NarL/FixJ family response regulator